MENIQNLSVYLLVIRSEGLLLVNEILDVIINGMMAMCPKKRLNAKEFGVDNTYGKMVAMLDQIIYMVRVWSRDFILLGSFLPV